MDSLDHHSGNHRFDPLRDLHAFCLRDGLACRVDVVVELQAHVFAFEHYLFTQKKPRSGPPGTHRGGIDAMKSVPRHGQTREYAACRRVLGHKGGTRTHNLQVMKPGELPLLYLVIERRPFLAR